MINISFLESDLIPGLGTFIACLVLQLEIGILCGIGMNVLFILYHAARPKISVEKLTVNISFIYCTKYKLTIIQRNSRLKYYKLIISLRSKIMLDHSNIYCTFLK